MRAQVLEAASGALTAIETARARDRRPQRLSRSGRRHGNEPRPHRSRRRRGDRGLPRGRPCLARQRDLARSADGRPRQLRGDPLPDRPRRRGFPRKPGRARPGPPLGERCRLSRSPQAGRRDDVDRRSRARGGCRGGRRPRRRDRARRRLRGPDARDAPGPRRSGRRRCGRRRPCRDPPRRQRRPRRGAAAAASRGRPGAADSRVAPRGALASTATARRS